MYSKGFVLNRFDERGVEIARLEHVPRLALSEDWTVSYMPANRHEPTPAPSIEATPRPAADRARQNADRPPTKGQVEVFGSTQDGFANKPTVKVDLEGQGSGCRPTWWKLRLRD